MVTVIKQENSKRGTMDKKQYPKVDRSGLKPNFAKKDEDDSIDIGFTEGRFNDGRPFRSEFWAASQTSCLTYYFSSIDMEDMSPSDLKEYLKSEHSLEFLDETFHSCGYKGDNIEAKKSIDASGNKIWEVTIIVGDDDGTYIRENSNYRGQDYEGRFSKESSE